MNLAKKLAKIFSLIFLAGFVASCDSGCVEAYEFDKELVAVESNPVKDGIQGLGDSQVATWHDTGLKTNGEAITLEVTGAWVPWYGDDDVSGEAQLNATPNCKFCAMNGNSPNCICYANQTTAAETGYNANDCASNLAAQNDPTKCTCTTQYGSATDYGTYHFPLNKYDKSHAEITPDKQEYCKYSAGMGLYIGLFGNSGSVTPTRAYHLFSQVAACDVVRDSVTGKCLDALGNDITKYIFTSANDRTFVKDDNNGNNGTDSNSGDDVLHSRNELVKLIIYDSRYDDNYGGYKVAFVGGVGDDQDKGLLEYLVRLIEDQIIGTPDSNGVRQGGIIQTMFSQIVQNSGFISVLQMGLSFYILFYGVSVLIGLADVNKKELMNRIVKIGFVIFFTSSTSWYWYDKVVVSFFKDSMDSVITIFMSFSDQNIDPTSGIITAQMDRASLDSNATRFSYADLIIKNLLSVAAAKKIFGLFFGVPLFGPVYIVMIYGLIAFFIFVMLTVAMFYVVTVVKLAFVLALGPIFIAFTLSSHTNDMFKKWLSFAAARSLEIVFMFLVLYNFLVLIDQNFTSLLGYKACVTQWNLGLFAIPILKSQVDRSLVEWFTDFMMLAGLIFITKLVIEKVPEIAASLITIGGTAGPSGAKGFAAAGGMTGGLVDMAKTAGFAVGGAVASAGAKTYQGVSPILSEAASSAASTVSGVVRTIPGVGSAIDTVSKVSSMLPSNPRAMYRNTIIDASIARAEKEANSKGLTGKDKDMAIRNAVVNSMLSIGDAKNTTLATDFAKLTAAGINLESIKQRLDDKLINQPLMNFIKSESAKLKSEADPKIGRELRSQLETRINDWADKNLSGGAAAVKDLLNNPNRIVDGVSFSGVGFNNMKQFIRSQTEYTAAEAAKAFASKPEKQQEYLQHLKDNQFRQDSSRQRTNEAVAAVFGKDSSIIKGLDFARDGFSKVARAVKPFDNAFGNDALTDSKRAAASFMRKTSNEELKTGSTHDFVRRRTGSWLDHDQGSVLNPFNLMKNKAAIRQEIKEGDRSGMIRYLSKGGAEKEQEAIKKNYDDKIKAAPNHAAKMALENKKQAKLRESEKRRGFFKTELAKNAVKSATKNSAEVKHDLNKIKRMEDETRDKFYKQIANIFTPVKTDAQHQELLKKNKEIEKEKQEQLKKIAQMKVEVKSVADVVKEIKALEKPLTIAEKSAAKVLGKNVEDVEKERNEMAAALRERLQNKLQKEYDEALAKHAEKQKEFLNLSPAEKTELDKLNGKALQEALRAHLEKAYPAVDLEKSLAELDQIRGKALQEALKVHLEKVYSAADLKKSLAELDQLSGKALQETLKAHLEKAYPVHLKKSLAALDSSKRAKLKEYGEIDALKDGLTELEGADKTLFERAARLDYYNSQLLEQKGDGENVVESSFDQRGTHSVDATQVEGSDVGQAAVGMSLTDTSSPLLAQQVKDRAAVIAAKVEAKKAAGNIRGLKQEFDELEDLKDSYQPDLDDDEDDDQERPEYDASAIRHILEIQLNILAGQFEFLKNNKEREVINLGEFNKELQRNIGDTVILKKIESAEARVLGYEREMTSLGDALSQIRSQISALG